MAWLIWLAVVLAVVGSAARWAAGLIARLHHTEEKLAASETNESRLSARVLRMERERETLARRCAALEAAAIDREEIIIAREATIYELNIKQIAAQGALRALLEGQASDA